MTLPAAADLRLDTPPTPGVISAPTQRSLLPAFVLALGTFAIGTGAYTIAPLLPRIAADLALPLPTIALLITVFALVVGVTSPILTVLTANLNRRLLLIVAMSAFTIANVVAWLSTDFSGLLVAQVLLATAAGLYIPNANALAGSSVAPDMRGRALAIVNGGMTIAIALGLPLGSLVGHTFGWRAAFLAVGMIAAIAVAGISFGLDRKAGFEAQIAGLDERATVARQPKVLKALLVTLFWATGAYAAYPFVAVYLHETLNSGDVAVAAIISLWGAGGAIGVLAGGALNDRFGSYRVIVPSLALLGLSFAMSGTVILFFTATTETVVILLAVTVWGASVWSFVPAQMARLIQAGGERSAPVALSLNTSVMYAGFAIGSGLGSLAIAHSTASELMLAAALIEFAGLALFLAWNRKR